MNFSDSHQKSSIDNCRLIDIAVTGEGSGFLAVMENGSTAPFDIKRTYFIYDVPAGSERGGHSHIDTHEFVVALSGSFDVVIDDGHRQKHVRLNSPNKGLLLTSGIWRTLDNFSSGAVCLVLASDAYSEDDYIRDYEEFKRLTAEKK